MASMPGAGERVGSRYEHREYEQQFGTYRKRFRCAGLSKPKHVHGSLPRLLSVGSNVVMLSFHSAKSLFTNTLSKHIHV